MTGGFRRWFTVRQRKAVAVSVAGWMSLSLVLAFWPCCETLADEHPPVTSMQAGGHDHDRMPRGTKDPCRTWLDTTDATLNTSPDVLLSDFELKPGHAPYVDAHDFPPIPLPVRDGIASHPSPPDPLPLYLRVQHLLI